MSGPRVPRTFWFALVPGVALIGYGVVGLLAETDGAERWSVARWFVGGNLAHDLLVSPAVCLVGFLVARWLPDRIRGPVQGALVATGAVAVVAYPLVRGYGVTAGEPSFLSRNYTVSVLELWVPVWLVAAAVVLRRRSTLRSDDGPRPGSPPQSEDQ